MNDSHGQKTRFTLKACRVNKGLTIKEAAKKLNISEFTLMNYELGKTFPTVPKIGKIGAKHRRSKVNKQYVSNRRIGNVFFDCVVIICMCHR